MMTVRLIIVVTLLGIMVAGIYCLQNADVLQFHDYNVSGLPVKVEKAAAPALVEQKSVTFVTYNVLVDEIAVDKRLPVLFRLMRESNADIIAMQEVGDWFLALLQKETWAGKYYLANSDPMNCGGNVILSKYPVKAAGCLPLPGKQARTALLATFDVAGRKMSVATTHMDSPLESGDIRGRQLDVIFEHLAHAQDAVMLGDLNFGDGEGEDKKIPADYVDLWKALKGSDPGFTWDNEKSGMANESRFVGEPSRRLDRILVRSTVWKPKDTMIIGDTPVVEGNKGLFPSDHFGLVGAMTRD
ncbi:MAG: endonuclease/exonuclease/phosphatase family protein [Alphaproteobacteria bacterium]